MRCGICGTGSFNTQPPEGGWFVPARFLLQFCSFNTQPPEGGWFHSAPPESSTNLVSTHSRLKAAGGLLVSFGSWLVGFNTQPPEGGWVRNLNGFGCTFSFNTQPPEGGWASDKMDAMSSGVFQHTAA